MPPPLQPPQEETASPVSLTRNRREHLPSLILLLPWEFHNLNNDNYNSRWLPPSPPPTTMAVKQRPYVIIQKHILSPDTLVASRVWSCHIWRCLMEVFSSHGYHHSAVRDLPYCSRLISPATSHIPCKFYKGGKCTAGSSCGFSHEIDTIRESTVCKFFLKGTCKFGYKCALSHQLELTNASLDIGGSPVASPARHRRGSMSYRGMESRPGLVESRSSQVESRSSQVNTRLSMDSGMSRPTSLSRQTSFFEEDSTLDCSSGPLPRQQPLPSPESIKNPCAPLPIRHKSMPDIFRWSADDGNVYPSCNFLFYSSSFEEVDPIQELQSRRDRMERTASESSNNLDTQKFVAASTSTSGKQSRLSANSIPGHSSPDPFSPFLGDFTEKEDEATFLMESDANSSAVIDSHVQLLRELQAENLPLDVLSEKMKNLQLRQIQLCPFAASGKCRFGDRCRYVHGETCPSCRKDCLHPYRQEEHEGIQQRATMPLTCHSAHHAMQGRGREGDGSIPTEQRCRLLSLWRSSGVQWKVWIVG